MEPLSQEVTYRKLTMSLSVAPLYLLFKDHKGWSLETGTAPPSRPVVSAGSGQNDHLSEIFSNILEPVVKTWKRGMEVQSTGDLVAKVNLINEMEMQLEDVDLEQVDKEIEEQERAADETYNNFDSDMTFRKEGLDDDTIQPGWKVNPEKSEKSGKEITEKQHSNRLEKDDKQAKEVMAENKELRDTNPEDIEKSSEEYSRRMETKHDKLRMKWAGTDYEIVTEKLEGMANWMEEENQEIKESLMDWMLDNDELTLVEEGEDILDGLEMMEKDGEIAGDLLLDSTEIITMIIARNLCSDRIPVTFQQARKNKPFPVDGNQKESCATRRVESMKKMRELLSGKKNLRKTEGSKEVHEDDFPEMEFKQVRRRESSRRMKHQGVQSDMVANDLIQDRGAKLQIVGSDVAALYPSLEAVEVAKIVYNAIMETDVKFSGVNYTEAC